MEVNSKLTSLGTKKLIKSGFLKKCLEPYSFICPTTSVSRVPFLGYLFNESGKKNNHKVSLKEEMRINFSIQNSVHVSISLLTHTDIFT